MITGIIFMCLIEEAVCKPFPIEFDTVQECTAITTKLIEDVGDTPGIVLYSICEADGEPV